MSDRKPQQYRTGGRLRRLIELRRRSPTRSTGWVEDDFHFFGVTIDHDGGTITDVRAEARRFPWSTCPGAVLPLRILVGAPIFVRASEIGRYIKMRHQCTHMFDLAGLVVAHIARGEAVRRYESIVEDRDLLSRDGIDFKFGRGKGLVKRDGALVLEWMLDDNVLTAPEDAAGRVLGRGFREWTEEMNLEEAEAATILRRTFLVSGGRAIDMDDWDLASEAEKDPVCFTFARETAPISRRMKGSAKDYAKDSSDQLLGAEDIPGINQN